MAYVDAFDHTDPAHLAVCECLCGGPYACPEHPVTDQMELFERLTREVQSFLDYMSAFEGFEHLTCVPWERGDATLFIGSREFTTRYDELGDRVLWVETGGW
jgi:hypothetical protein